VTQPIRGQFLQEESNTVDRNLTRIFDLAMAQAFSRRPRFYGGSDWTAVQSMELPECHWSTPCTSDFPSLSLYQWLPAPL